MFVIIDELSKTIYYKLIKITLNINGQLQIQINVILKHFSLFNSIISNKNILFTSKFYLFVCYFRDIKEKTSITFHTKQTTRLKNKTR